MSTISLGPDDGTLRVNTYRQGVAAKVGHDLVIAVRAWSAEVETADDGSVRSFTFDADSRSLEVLEGHNGVKPLSDKDRTEIAKNIDAKVLRGERIQFASSAIEGTAVSGALTMNGVEHPASFALEQAGGRLRGTATVAQTEWGIKPYSALMGALKVRDEVEISVDVALAGGA